MEVCALETPICLAINCVESLYLGENMLQFS